MYTTLAGVGGRSLHLTCEASSHHDLVAMLDPVQCPLCVLRLHSRCRVDVPASDFNEKEQAKKSPLGSIKLSCITKHFIHEVSEPSPGHRKSSKKEGKLACPGHPHHTTHRFADSRSQKHRLRQAFELASPWPAQELQLLVHRSIQDIFASEAWFGR